MQKINVKIAERGYGFISEINMKFLNGEVTVPNRPGGYVIASGCGSGKTTVIRQLILSEYRKGVLYSAATIRECNEMHSFLVNNGIDKDRIIVLHSDVESDGVDMRSFRNNPFVLADKWIVICTHHKLLNEYPEAFLKYNCYVYSKSRMSHLTRGYYQWGEDGKCRMPRQYILVDELPTCKSFGFDLELQSLGLLGVSKQETQYDEEGRSYITDKIPLELTNGGNYKVTESKADTYNIHLAGPVDTELGKMKNDLALSIVFDDYCRFNEIFKSNRNLRSIRINYTLSDQVNEIPNTCGTRFIIFDGTGDLTFIPKSDSYCPFTLLTYSNKYNSPISINKVEIGYKRSYKNDNEFNDKRSQLISNIKIQVENISNIIRSNHKVLILTWKDLKVKDERRGIPIDEYDRREIGYVDFIRNELMSYGFIEGMNFSIIHYQSGLDRATNEFREFDTVYFLGEFHVPTEVVNQFNQDYRVGTSVLNYTLYQLVQAVCRTRIRLHNMSPIDIYYTSDWDKYNDDIMKNLGGYLSSNSISEIRDTTLNNVKPKWRSVIELFCSLSPEFKDAIEIEGKTCMIEFTLDEIWELTREVLPVNRKKVESYYSLINYLKKFGIELKINSNGGRFTSENNPSKIR